MQTVSLEQVRAELPELLLELGQHDQLVIMEGGKPLAVVKKTDLTAARPNIFGCCHGMFEYEPD